jgi:hypothetical protein
VLLAVGNASTLALAFLPQSFNRPLAVPTGVALIGLGVSLWRDQRNGEVADAAGSAPAASTTVAGAETQPVVSVR